MRVLGRLVGAEGIPRELDERLGLSALNIAS